MRARTAVLTHGGRSWNFDARSPAAPGEWVLEGVSGWYGGVGVRGTSTDRLGHGTFEQRAFRGDRALTLQATYVAEEPDEREAIERDISGVLWDGTYGSLDVSTEIALSADVRLDGEIGVVETGVLAITVQIPLVASDPFLYGKEQTVFLSPVGAGRGLEYPLFSKGGVLTYGTAIAERDSITNGGNATAYDDYLVVGDFPGGWRLTVNRKVIEWPWPTVLAAPVLVKMSGQIWIGDANVTDRASVRQWAPLAPGATVTPTLTPLQGGTGWAEAHHRDTYI